MLAAEIVYAVLGDLRGRSGLDIEEIIDDEEIYEELVDTLIDIVDTKLKDKMQRFLSDE